MSDYFISDLIKVFKKKFKASHFFYLEQLQIPKNLRKSHEKRKYVREKIYQFLKEKHKVEWNSLLDLNLAPQEFQTSETKIYLSISHYKEFALFVISDIPVGIDLELKSRVSESIIDRISVFEEKLKVQKNHSHLWSIKESVYKCIPRSMQPATISEIQILDYSKADYSKTENLLFEENKKSEIYNSKIDIWQFDAITQKNSQIRTSGFCFELDLYQISISVVVSN